MGNRSKHEFDTLAKQSLVLKSHVFKILTKLEQAEKPSVLKTKKNIKDKESEPTNLRVYFEKEVESLKKMFLQAINENCKILQTEVGRFSEQIDKLSMYRYDVMA